MQEIQMKDMPDVVRRELFHGKDESHVFKQMENRLQELDEPLVSRTMLHDRAACPCKSGKIFKNCCKGKTDIPSRKQVDIEELAEKVDALERKIDLTFGGHVLINGQWVKP